MNKKVLLGILFVGFFLFGIMATTSPVVGLADGERLMRTKLRIGGGDLLLVDSSVDADDWSLVDIPSGGTKMIPCVDGLIFPKGIDFDIADAQFKMYGMNTAQYDDEVFINSSCDSGTKIEETGGNGDPVETTAFSIGSEYGYGKVTLNADSGDTYAGYYWQTDFFNDVDNDGVHDDAEDGFLSDFNEDAYIIITAKADWSNVSATAGDNIAEISLVFTTSGTNFEIEAQITADADGNTGWTNFDDGSADNKATFLYANADAQVLVFYFDLSIMDYYDEDDYSSIKGLDYIDYRLIGYGDGATAELWVYNVAFIKNPSLWSVDTDKRPSITKGGELDVDDDFIPSYTAGSESDGGMYLNMHDDTDYPCTAVTESSSVTSAYSNLINTDTQIDEDDYTLPLNYRKVKFESDQSGTNKEDDVNIDMLPTTYSAVVVKSSPDGGVIVKETFTWDFTGMDDIETSGYLLTWDTSTDKIYVQDYLLYDNMADDIWDSKDPSELVVDATEGLANTFDATDELKSAWAGETDEAYIQYTINKQPDTTTGDILKFVRQVRYSSEYCSAKGIAAQVGGSFWTNKVFTPTVFLLGGGGLLALIIALASKKKKRR